MKYYFCVDVPYENTCIWMYNSLKELKAENAEYMKNNNDWFVIKGREINV